MSPMKDWQATADLAPGITLLEASAGTGKTYNITSLVLRLVAEHEVQMSEMVVVTFTRAATAELRDRIRIRLGEAVEALDKSDRPQSDEVVQLLWDVDDEERAKRARRLRDAQECFDECLISTIHGFCQRMLQQNAFESQADFDLELVESTADLVEELVDDWLSMTLHAPGDDRYGFFVETCKFNRDKLLKLAELALRDPDMKVLPDPGEVDHRQWEAERAKVQKLWTDGGMQTAASMYEDAHERGEVLKQTYIADKCLERGQELSDWLESQPGMESEPDHNEYWTAKNVQKFLAAGAEEPTCDAIEAVRKLLEFPDRAAACERAKFVHWLREEFDRKNRHRRVQSFQDLMRNLAHVLGSEQGDAARKSLVAAIGGRFKVALIDEFQDTDALQWTIFSSVFADGTHRLYVIGDPKQAIYLFRGANVHVYLEAQQRADRSFTMRTSYRSDARLIDAFNCLMQRTGYFGEEGIDYVKVGARDRTPEDRVGYAGKDWSDPYTAPLQIRFIDQRLGGAEQATDQDDRVTKGAVGALLPRRVAADIVELLESGMTLEDENHPDAGKGGHRPVRPGDIAVLTRTGYQARNVHAALGAVGVPAVLMGADSVLASDEAREIQFWLDALVSQGQDRPARRAATTRLFGRDAALLARVDAEEPAALHEWEEWLERLAGWRKRFAKEGFLRTLRSAVDEDLYAAWDEPDGERLDATTRLLRRPDGDRRLTNVWHVAELLHEAETRERLQLPGLLAWLIRQRAKPTVDTESAELRLERDDEAVRILTMHKSKGLQFSVVFAPFLYDGKGPKEDDLALVVPSEKKPANRELDLTARIDREQAYRRAWRESKKEEIRLFYVALTRARYRAVLYAGHINELENSPLAPTLHGAPLGDEHDRIEAGAKRCEGAARSQLLEDLEKVADESATKLPGGHKTISVSICEQPKERKWSPKDAAEPVLVARDFLRPGPDLSWKRHSYSRITPGEEATKVPEVDDREGFDPDPDEQEAPAHPAELVDEAVPKYDLPETVKPVPLASFPAGKGPGTFLHEVFQYADFEWVSDAQGEEGAKKLRELIQQRMVRYDFEQAKWLDTLQDGLTLALRTPLGAVLGGTRLCDIPKSTRFDELTFDFPIAGGDKFGKNGNQTRVTFAGIVNTLRRRKQVLGDDDEAIVRSAYLAGLEHHVQMAGFMTGMIDMVFCHEVKGTPQWFVVDYKSNRIDPRRERRYPVEHFDRKGMRYAMEHAHYYLQYHLYLLALHRYLKWRMGDEYSYEKHIGGVYYLFFRGLVGDDTPTEGKFRHGSFFDRPPVCVIDALDQLFRDPAAGAKGGAR